MYYCGTDQEIELKNKLYLTKYKRIDEKKDLKQTVFNRKTEKFKQRKVFIQEAKVHSFV